MTQDFFARIPDELLELIILNLSPVDTVSFGSTCQRGKRITHEALVWRRHCIEGWKYWSDRHEFTARLAQPPARTKWRHLYNQRKKQDDDALSKFNTMLVSQQRRLQYLGELSSLGYDVKDLMLELENHTPDDAEDVLARRYYANVVRSKMHREMAVNTWDRLARRQMVSLDDALGSYDLFTLSGMPGDLGDINRELDRLASAITDCNPNFDSHPTRMKAVSIASYLRSEGILGTDLLERYHALPNNFLSLALLQVPHRSLPLQSAAIYCGVARRLGVDARPSNFPNHVYVVVQAPRGYTLNGRWRDDDSEERETMHMDPWRSSEEVQQVDLVRTLIQMGTPANQYTFLMGPSSTVDSTLRAGRNIMNSVSEARDRMRTLFDSADTTDNLDSDKAFYGMLWAAMILGDGSPSNSIFRRRSTLPYLIQHYQAHFPEDVDLLNKYVLPMFLEYGELSALTELIAGIVSVDRQKKAPSLRDQTNDMVEYKVGTHFTHKRYAYSGIIIGWDTRCEAGEPWINQMRVNELPRGREQPFYHVLSDDKSVRYVAQENIHKEEDEPGQKLMLLAGQHFKRWDAASKMFISNIRDEYPDD